nr:hypothetical protein [Rhodoferax sp.]
MSLEEPSIRNLLDTKVSLHPATRVLLACIVIAGGLAFAAFGAVFFFHRPSTPYPHPLGAAIFSLVILAFGVGFVWVGARLVRKRAESENLLSPLARRRSSLVVACLAAAALALAVEADSLQFLVTGVGLLLFSYWLFTLDQR